MPLVIKNERPVRVFIQCSTADDDYQELDNFGAAAKLFQGMENYIESHGGTSTIIGKRISSFGYNYDPSIPQRESLRDSQTYATVDSMYVVGKELCGDYICRESDQYFRITRVQYEFANGYKADDTTFQPLVGFMNMFSTALLACIYITCERVS